MVLYHNWKKVKTLKDKTASVIIRECGYQGHFPNVIGIAEIKYRF